MKFSKERRGALASAVFACILGAFLMPLDQPNAAAQAVLYDNTQQPWSANRSQPETVIWAGGEAGDWFEAQPFKLGGHDNVASVSFPMARDVSVTATGSIRYSIWEDNGQGLPGHEAGELGILDVDALERFDFPGNQGGPEPPSILPLVTFEAPIDDLVPGETYHVVADYRDLRSYQFGDVLWGLSNSPVGSNRAGDMQVTSSHARPPFEDSDWVPISNFFGAHRYLQMSVTSADDPYSTIVCPVGETYHQEFSGLGSNGQATTFLPLGWAFSDDGRIFDSSVTEDFPAGNSLGRGTPVFNAGMPDDLDRALALGVTRTSGEGMFQLVAEVAGGDATSVQLQFDIEAWDAARSRDLPGEAAFNVALDLDTGDGFVELLDLGTITTGATLLPPAVAELVDGNSPGNRFSFDSGLIDADLPEGSLLRVRWMADTEAQTRGWVYGLDNVSLGMFAKQPIVSLLAGDADQDLDFDQLDLVQVQVAAKYLTGQAATWGEGDWDGAPGGEPGNPPAGDDLFNQFDIIAAQQAAAYLAGPYAAVRPAGSEGDGQTSVVYDTNTGELSVDAPDGTALTSINIDSASGIFTGDAAANLGGSFDNDSDGNIFKATFGSSFGSVSFGNVTQAGLSEDFLLNDLSVVGSRAGGGDLGNVDLVYVPEPTSSLLLAIGLGIGLVCVRRVDRGN